MKERQKESAGYAKLTEILSEAVAHGADAVDLEYESGGCLEVCLMVGNSGAGYLLDRELGRQVGSSVWDESKKGRGKFRIALHGKDYMVQVQIRENFGDHAYRLTFKEARGAGGSGGSGSRKAQPKETKG